MWFVDLFITRNIFRYSNTFIVFLNGFLKLGLPIGSLVMAIIFPYNIIPAHVNLIKSLVQYTSHVVVATIILLIFLFSFRFNEIMGFLYLNSLVALSIDFFRRATRGNKMKKTRIKGYIIFVTLLCALVLIAMSALICYLKTTSQGISIIAIQKRQFLSDLYQRSAPNMLYIFILGCIFMYLKNIKRMMEKAKIEFRIIDESSEVYVPPVAKDSLFVTYFSKRMVPILQLGTHTLIDANLRFKFTWLRTIVTESEALQRFYQPFFEERKNAHKSWMQMKGQAYFSSFDMGIYFMSLLLTRIHYGALLIVTLYLFFLMSDVTSLQNVYQFCYMFWFLLIGLDLDYVGTIRTAAFLVNPAFIFDQMYQEARSIQDFYTSEGQSEIQKYKLSNVFALVFMLLYCFILTFKDKKSFSGKLTKKIVIRLNKFKERRVTSEKTLRKNLYMLFELIGYKALRFVALCLTIYSGLSTVNVFNCILIFMCFFIMADTSRDNRWMTVLHYYVIFMILEVYISRIADGYITPLNAELINFFGLYAGNVPIYVDRIRAYLVSFIFISLTNMARDYMQAAKDELKPEYTILAYWKIVQAVEGLVRPMSRLMYSYMIWVFHSVIMTLIFLTGLNFFSSIVFFAEALIFCLQLYQWLKDDASVYQSLLSSWQLIYKLIILNTFYRWLTYIPRYVSIKRMLTKVFGSILSDKLLPFVFDAPSNNVDYLLADFFFDAVLLTLAIFTTHCLEMKVELLKVSSIAKIIAPLAKSMENKPAAVDQSQSNLEESLLKGDENNFPILEPEKPVEELHPALLPALVAEPIVVEAEKMPTHVNRNTSVFTASILMFKGFNFIYLGLHTTTNPNLYKLMLIILPMIYFSLLFIRIEQSIIKFKIRKLITLYLKYFMVRFVETVNPSKVRRDFTLLPMPEGRSRDIMHNESFIGQFLRKMELDIIKLSNSFWPVVFILWLIYSLVLYTVRILMEYGLDMSSFFTYFGLIESTMRREERFVRLRNEQFGNQAIFTILIIEFLVLHYYLDLATKVEEMEDHKIDQLVNLMETKVEYYTTDPTDLNAEKLREILEKDIRAYEDNCPELFDQFVKYEKEDPHERIIRFTGMSFTSEEENKFVEKNLPPSNLAHSNLEVIQEGDEFDDKRSRHESANYSSKKLAAPSEPGSTLLKKESEAFTVNNGVGDSDGVIESSNVRSDNSLVKSAYLSSTIPKGSTVLSALDEDTNTQVKILYKERNQNYLNIAKIFNALSFICSRLVLLPLLYSLSDPGLITLLYLIISAAYVFSGLNGSFESNMKIFLPIFLFSIFAESVFEYYSCVIDKTIFNPNRGRTIKNSFYRFWLVGVISTGFAAIIWTARFIFIDIFLVKQKSEFIFFDYNLVENRIDIIFNQWKYYNISMARKVITFLMMYINDLFLTGAVCYCILNSDSKAILIFMLLIFGYMIMVRSKKLLSTLAIDERKNDFICWILLLFVGILFLIEIVYKVMQVLRDLKVDAVTNTISIDEKPTENIRGTNLMIIYTLLFYDMLKVTNYAMERRRYCRTAEIHQKLSDMCYAQMINEKKIFERVNMILAKDRLQNQIDHYLKKGILNSTADLNYYKVDIRTMLSEARFKYLGKYLESFNVVMIGLSEGIYNKILANSNTFERQDLLYLLAKVSMLDQGIITSCDLSLVDYLSGDLAMFDNVYNDIVAFYTNLVNKEPSEYELYKTRLKEFELKMLEQDIHVDNEFEMFSFVPQNQGGADEPGTATLSIYKTQKSIRSRLQRKNTNKPGNSPLELRSSTLPMESPNLRSSLIDSPELLRRSIVESPTQRFRKESEELSPLERNRATTSSGSVFNKKRKEDLSQATKILFNFLKHSTSTLEYGNNFTATENKAVFRLDSENCTVVFHDIIRDSLLHTKGFMKLNMADLFPMAVDLLYTNLEFLISLFVIITLFLTGGLLSAVILGILFFRIMIEEYGGRASEWKTVSIIFLLQFILKLLGSWGTQLQFKFVNFTNYLVFLGGMIEQDWQLKLDALALLAILWQIQLSLRKINNSPEANVLINQGVTVARYVLGEKVKGPFYDVLDTEWPKLGHSYDIVKEATPNNEAKRAALQGMYLNFYTKELLEVNKVEFSFMKSMMRFILGVKNDIYMFNDKISSQLSWRNFTIFSRKNGTKMMTEILIVFLFCIAALVIFYPRINPTPYDISKAFFNDEIKDDLYWPLLVFLGFVSVQMYFLSSKSTDTAGMVSKRYFDNYLNTQKLTLNEDRLIGPLEKYRKVTRSIINVFRVFKPKKNNSDDHKSNPMFMLYISVILLWVYFSYLFYLKLILKGHFDSTITSFSDKISCFYSQTMLCHNHTAYIGVKVIYGFCLCWILILLVQMKEGIQVWASSIRDFDTINSIKFAIYGGLPFLKEISVMLGFASNKTALSLDQWFVMEDIQNTMTKAKFTIKGSERQEFGEIASAATKTIFKIGAIIFAVLVMIGPMIPFADILSGDVEYPVTATSIQIDVLTKTGETMTPFYTSDMILRTDTIPRGSARWAFLETTNIWNRTKPNFFKYVKMSKYSQTYFDYSPTADFNSTMVTQLTGGNIRIQMKLSTDEANYTNQMLIPISKINAEEIKSVMETDCRSVRLNREMFLTSYPMVYTLEGNGSMVPLGEPNVQMYVPRKWSLGVECSYQNSSYFFISTDKDKELEFGIITRPKLVTLDMASKLLGSRIQIIFLYAFVFYYLGMVVLRPSLFNKTTNIWYDEVPKPEVLFILLDAIEMARYQQDYLKEDMLYFYMIELLRNPEDLKTLTGSMLEHRLAMYREIQSELEEIERKKKNNITLQT